MKKWSCGSIPILLYVRIGVSMKVWLKFWFT